MNDARGQFPQAHLLPKNATLEGVTSPAPPGFETAEDVLRGMRRRMMEDALSRDVTPPAFINAMWFGDHEWHGDASLEANE